MTNLIEYLRTSVQVKRKLTEGLLLDIDDSDKEPSEVTRLRRALLVGKEQAYNEVLRDIDEAAMMQGLES